jgi:hypothetical protein
LSCTAENRFCTLESEFFSSLLDRWHNAAIGLNIARFISLISDYEWIIVVGTPTYRQKYENRVSETGSVVAAEMDLIHQRLTGTEEQKKTILPILLERDEQTSFPPLLHGRVYADFRREELYFQTLLDSCDLAYRAPHVTFASG